MTRTAGWTRGVLIAFALTATLAHGDPLPRVGKSPWGDADELGRLNLMTDASRLAVLAGSVAGASTISASSTTWACRASAPWEIRVINTG